MELQEIPELEDHLGSRQGLALWGASVLGERLQRVNDPAGLQHFLDDYFDQLMAPVELEAILEAHSHATCGRSRELIQLDQRLTNDFPQGAFIFASQQIGRSQLRKLRPLRGQKIVQRYLDAIRRGGAKGWHTVVYGMVLALNGIPLRQGLIHYGAQTMDGFIRAAQVKFPLLDEQADAIHGKVCSRLSGAVQQTIQKAFPDSLQLV